MTKSFVGIFQSIGESFSRPSPPPPEGLSLATEQELSACLWVLEAALGGEVSMPWCGDLRVVFFWLRHGNKKVREDGHQKIMEKWGGGGFFNE